MLTSSRTYADRATETNHPITKKLFQLMEEKETNLAIAADVTTSQELLTLAEQVGEEICIFKTHIDIIEDFTPALTTELKKLAQKHNFLIFEDRKFADIGNTVQLQFTKGVYRISSWADIVNAHALPGPGQIEALKKASPETGLLLLAQMSSQGNLLDDHYALQTLKMAQEYPDFVMGFISQKRLSEEPGFVYMTPGVQLTAKGDALGQKYRTPEQAIIDQQNDVIIVGRGISKATDPKAEAQRYRQAGWEAYRSLRSVLQCGDSRQRKVSRLPQCRLSL